MITIEPGVELDRAVAEAIGLEIVETHCGTEVWFDNGNGTLSQCNPSVNLNAAFAAAERVGLFDPDGPEAFLAQHPAGSVEWKVWWEDSDDPDGGHAVYKSTPALAICAAILELEEKSHA